MNLFALDLADVGLAAYVDGELPVRLLRPDRLPRILTAPRALAFVAPLPCE